MAGAVALKLAYGYNIERGGDDLLVDMAETSLARFAYSTQPGAWLVDVLPFCEYNYLLRHISNSLLCK